jgi:hypothetical protein
MNIKLKRLTEQRNAINARIRDEEQKLNEAARKLDRNRKILEGACAEQMAKRDSDFAALFMKELDTFLVRDRDRALFDLPPLPEQAKPKRGEWLEKIAS